MTNVEITHVDGTKGMITHAELIRLSKLINVKSIGEDWWESTQEMKKQIHEGKEKASKNIQHLVGWMGMPCNEDSVKEALYKGLSNTSREQACLLYEAMEFAIANSLCELFNK